MSAPQGVRASLKPSILRQVLQLGWPSALSQIISFGSVMITVLAMAQMGHDVLAASALITMMTFTVILFCSGIFFALGPLLGQMMGRGERDNIVLTVQASLCLALLLSVFAMIIYVFIQPLLLALGQAPALALMAARYFHVFLFAMPGIMMILVMRQFLQTVGQQYFCLLATFCSLLLMGVLTYVLAFGHWGFPRLGIQGIAWANLVQAYSNVIIMLLAARWLPVLSDLALFRRVEGAYLKAMQSVWVMGWPIAVQLAAEMLGFKLSIILVGWLGVNALAAKQVASQWITLAIVPVFGLQQAVSILVGKAHGAQRRSDLLSVHRLSLRLCLGMTVLASCLMMLFYKPLILLYLHRYHHLNAQTYRWSTVLLFLNSIMLVPESLAIMLAGSLRGINDNRYPMRVSLWKFWVFYLPLGSLLAFPLHFGVIGLALAFLLTSFATWFLLHRRWNKMLFCINR
jgi:multidrug resistance protein, MATE family